MYFAAAAADLVLRPNWFFTCSGIGAKLKKQAAIRPEHKTNLQLENIDSFSFATR